jgi:hypothetical protein
MTIKAIQCHPILKTIVTHEIAIREISNQTRMIIMAIPCDQTIKTILTHEMPTTITINSLSTLIE